MQSRTAFSIREIVAAVFYSCIIATGIVIYANTSASGHVAEPAVSVDRTLKGDRLSFAPIPVRAISVKPSPVSSPAKAAAPDQTPVGCDPAFSPVASPEHARVYLRCIS